LTSPRTRSVLRWLAVGAASTAAAYGVYAATTWVRYGRPSRPTLDNQDPLLDTFMPVYEIVERHQIDVKAPAAVTFAAACEADLTRSRVVRAVFKGREVMLGTDADSAERPRGLLALTTSLGWRRLAEKPGREIVMGAVTQPWEANVRFRGLPPEEFTAFNEPGYVKIAWTLRADDVNGTESIFRTETRAVATDAAARAKFRRYWSLLSPGIIIIRWMMLAPVKADAERRQEIQPPAAN
jgi:hypothetical protein